jgi:hypothetical protein
MRCNSSYFYKIGNHFNRVFLHPFNRPDSQVNKSTKFSKKSSRLLTIRQIIWTRIFYRWERIEIAVPRVPEPEEPVPSRNSENLKNGSRLSTTGSGSRNFNILNYQTKNTQKKRQIKRWIYKQREKNASFVLHSLLLVNNKWCRQCAIAWLLFVQCRSKSFSEIWILILDFLKIFVMFSNMRRNIFTLKFNLRNCKSK